MGSQTFWTDIVNIQWCGYSVFIWMVCHLCEFIVKYYLLSLSKYFYFLFGDLVLFLFCKIMIWLCISAIDGRQSHDAIFYEHNHHDNAGFYEYNVRIVINQLNMFVKCLLHQAILQTYFYKQYNCCFLATYKENLFRLTEEI